LIDADLIGEELEEWKSKILAGLDHFMKPSASSLSKVKSSGEVRRKEFILKLSKYLDLDEWQSHELFQNYLRIDFRGSGPQLLAILKHEAQLEGFLVKILDFYLKERSFMLRVIKHLISYSKDDTCLFKEQFNKIVKEFIDQKIIEKVIKKVKDISKQSPNHDAIKGNRVAQSKFAMQALLEQCELVEIILVYYQNVKMPPGRLLELAKLFRSQHFGGCQVNSSLLDPSSQLLIERYGYTTSLILLQALELDSIKKICSVKEEDFSALQLVADVEARKNIDEALLTWDDLPQQGPILMGWVVFRQIALKGEQPQLTGTYGEAALKCRVFDYLLSLLSSSFFNKENDAVTSIARSLVYQLYSLVLQVFHEDTLGSYQSLISLACKVLPEPSVALQFLTEDSSTGVALLIDSARRKFPFLTCPLVNLFSSLCCSTDTVDWVYNCLNEMKSHTELFGRNHVEEIEATEDENIWKRSLDRIVLQTGEDRVVIPRGSLGQVTSGPGDARLVRWSCNYSGWVYLSLQLDAIIESPMTFVSDSGEQTADLVNAILQLVTNVLTYDYTKSLELESFVGKLISIMQRFSRLQNPPIDILINSMKCLRLVAIHNPWPCWQQLQLIRFLPSSDTSLLAEPGAQNLQVSPGVVGSLLLSSEYATASYGLTLQYLEYFHEFLVTLSGCTIDDDDKSSLAVHQKDIVANLIFIIKDIFSMYSRWRYSVPEQRFLVGLNCLHIFHTILSPTFQDYSIEVSKKSGIPSLKAVTHEGLLYHDNGESLLTIISYGVDAIESSLTSNFSCKSDIVQLVKIAFSVVNKLIELQNEVEGVSPLESALCQQFVPQPSEIDFLQPAVNIPMLTVIAKYIYHREDPKLSILAVIVLRALALKFPMTLSASFGDSCIAIRNAFVNRLSGRVEPIRLKIAILEFLAGCVETQPGIVELFLHLIPEKSTDKSQKAAKMTLGKYSCITPTLDIIAPNEKQPFIDVLTSTAFDLIASLWKNRHDSALIIIKKSPDFWKHATLALKDIHSLKVTSSLLETLSSILKIIALETYYVRSDQYDKNLASALKSLSDGKSYAVLGELLVPHIDMDLQTANQMKELTRSWKMFLSVMTEMQADECGLTDESLQQDILTQVITALSGWSSLRGFHRGCKRDMCLELSAITLVLAKKWIRTLGDIDKLTSSMVEIASSLSASDEELYNTLTHDLFSFFLVMLQRDSPDADLSTTTLLEVVSLICETLHYHLNLSNGDDSDSANHVSVIAVSALSEIISRTGDSLSSFLQIVQQHATLPLLMQAADLCLRRKARPVFVEAVLRFFLVCSQYPQIAAILATHGISRFLSLSVSPSKSTDQDSQGNTAGSTVIWGLSIAIMARILKILRHVFVEGTFDFIGTHIERILQQINILQSLVSNSSLFATEQLSILLYEVSSYSAEASFALPNYFHQLKVAIGHMCQVSVALLARIKILTAIVESKADESISRILSRAKAPSPSTSFRSDSVRSYVKDDVVDNLSPDVEAAHASLVNILCNCVGAMRRLTPNVMESILDEGLDVDSFVPLVELQFGVPSLDGNMLPSFGTLTACLNTCLKAVYKMTQSDSDRTTPEKDLTDTLLPDCDRKRSLLWYIIDNTIIVIMSQASCYLRHPGIEARNKQFLRRELGSEMSNFLQSVHRYKTRRGVPPSPQGLDKLQRSSSSLSFRRSPSKLGHSFAEEEENTIFKLVDIYIKQLLR